MIRKPILASKEDQNFQEALKLYDQKQYKKSLKLVDQNLKKHSHAESLTLKGCINYQLGNKSECESYILKGIEKDKDNYMVNHLAGIYYRAIENYTESAKWLKAAVDNGSPNKQILRDLSILQSQIRDYKNLTTSRQQYLDFQPGYRANWTGAAIAFHLNKNYNSAYSTLTKIETIIKDHLQESDMYEQSECCLYKNDILFDAGNVSKALEELEKDISYIKDKLSYLSYKAKYLMILGNTKEASILYRKLIQRNPDDLENYKNLELCLGTSDWDVEKRATLYEKFARFYPKADVPKFLPLIFIPSTNKLFKTKVSEYILSQLKRGVPATFVNIKPVLKNSKKLKIVEEVVEEFYGSIDQYDPTVKLWTMYFISQLNYFKAKSDASFLDVSMKWIDLAIEHSPTLVELYLFKSRILKTQGKVVEASEFIDQGRQMDLQDRFVNSKTVKYYLRANNIDKAMELISLFTKLDNDAINGCKDLHTMQVNWFLTESAEAYSRLYHQYQEELNALPEDADEETVNDLKEKIDINKGLAIKRFLAVVKIFGIFVNDQFDFHSYCLRRGTPRHYVQTIKWEDEVHSTPIFVRVIKGLSKIYFEIYEEQKIKKQEEPIIIKKNNKKQKKAKAQFLKQKEDLIKKVESENDDSDPLGTKILNDLVNNSNGDIIDNLLGLTSTLINEAKDYKITWELSFKLNLIKSKYILCLQAVKNLKDKIDQDELKQYIRTLRDQVTADETTNNAIKMVVEKGLSSAFPDL